MTRPSPLTRRHLLAGALAGGVAGLALPPAGAAGGAPALVRTGRPLLTSGVASGDVTTSSAVLWARADRPSRLVAVVHGPRGSTRRVRGPWAGPDTDHTAKIELRGLRAGQDHRVSLAFEADGRTGETEDLTFRTGDTRPAATSFVWTGDTCGQGWGINPDLGGMTGYAAMHATRPDFFVHAGDTIYADGPIAETVVEPDGQVWRNVVTEEVAVVAQTLRQFRGRHRYTMLDENVRAMYAQVPVVAQWDDHETTNNWYPGEVLTDPRYDREQRVDVLARRARRAWGEYQPVPRSVTRGRGGDARTPGRLYRTVERGRHLDVFCLDMRTFKDPNTPGLERERTRILGREQADWLVREVSRSKATWKVISADLPLGIVVPDGPVDQESLSNRDPGAPLGKELELAGVLQALKRNRVRNVLWITADVHYCAAHHYDPSRASFTDFDPFWEIVAGPIAAGTFGPNEMDATFGPRVEFSKVADYPNQSPRGGNQFFGHVAIDAAGELTASLRDVGGTVLWSKTLEPARR